MRYSILALWGAVLFGMAAGISGAAAAQEGSAEPEPEAAAEGEPDGATLYLVNCRMCHGANGTAGAPLAGNAKLEDAEYVARTIVIGPGYMTEFGPILSDEEIAAIATHIRTSWGNEFGPVSPEEVAAVR